MFHPQRLLLLFLTGLASMTVAGSDRQQQCEAQGTCSSNSGCATNVCLPTAEPKDSIYRFGGTAQAYKVASPTKVTICNETEGKAPYRVATWPYRRAAYTSKIPKIFLTVNILACGESKKPTSCCCQPLNPRISTTVEAWQTRPDGTFGSLQSNVQDGVCRAQQQSSKGTFEFETFPPGSYGSLGGLGPRGWEFMPYGEPVIHFLVTSDEYTPTLVDVPIYFNFKTLQAKSSFGWNDWRGPSWMRQQTEETGFEIVSWKADPQRRTISIALNLFIQKLPPVAGTATASLPDAFCESSLYGLPSSFFREPMSVCGASLLDFFAL